MADTHLRDSLNPIGCRDGSGYSDPGAPGVVKLPRLTILLIWSFLACSPALAQRALIGADALDRFPLTAQDQKRAQAVIAAQGNEQSSPLLLPVEPGEAPEGVSAAEQPAAETGTAESAQEAPAAPVSNTPAAPAPAAPAAEPATPVAASAGQGVLNVQFTADCWTQVTDADGKVLLSALKRSGERIELAGKAPLELRLGFARGAQVTYNGESVDVAPHMTGETARLKLGL